MAALVRSRTCISRIVPLCRATVNQSRYYVTGEQNDEPITHTGQQFAVGDYRKTRFLDKEKLVTTKWAIDMVAEEPVVLCDQRVVFSDGGGPLGHPRVYINLDPAGEHVCGYSGRRFVHRRHYDEAKMGKSITYEQYLQEVKSTNITYPG